MSRQLRRRLGLLRPPIPAEVSFQDSSPSSSSLRFSKAQTEIVKSELGQLKEKNGGSIIPQLQGSTTAQVRRMPAPPQQQMVQAPVDTLTSTIIPTASSSTSAAAPVQNQPLVIPKTQHLNRRSSRVPKRKRRSSSPEVRPIKQIHIQPLLVSPPPHPQIGQQWSIKSVVSLSTTDPLLKTPEKEGRPGGGSPNGASSPSASLPTTLPVNNGDVNIMTKMDSVVPSIIITPEYFKGKNDFGAAVMVLVDKEAADSVGDKLPFTTGWLQCGICCNIFEITDNVSQFKKHGAYLCGKCIPFLTKMFKIAKRAEALVCSGGSGSCPFPSDGVSAMKDYCEACFVQQCLLLLDVDDTMYFKLWRAVPPIARRSSVPSAPPKIKIYAGSRGKVLWVNKSSGAILQVATGISSNNSKNGKSGGTATKKTGLLSKNKKTDDEGIKLEPTVPIMEIKAEEDVNGLEEKGKVAENKRVTRGGGGRSAAARNKTGNRGALDSEGETVVLPIKSNETETAKTEKVNNNNSNIAIKEEPIKHEKPEPVKEADEEEPAAEPDKAIKVIPPPSTTLPSDLDEAVVEKHGYPVIVVAGQEPPSPLCFSCGSAGINQLVYCCACCQPFHPYCSEDELLLASYLTRINHSSSELLAVDTPTPDLAHKFRKWKCSRCITCSRCGTGRELEDEFVGCSLCASSYHLRCAKKMPLKPGERDRDKWVCSTCLRCTSCLIPLTKSSHHLRKLGAAAAATTTTGTSTVPDILCLECFRRRQRGSFCPVCFVCYDDNDWDSKMMECDKCQRWIHAQCEGLNDERYFVLSGLPEAITYVCRLCQPPVNVGWRQAVETELLEGCLRILELFQRKVIGVSRKRRALSFDIDLESNNNNESPLRLSISCPPTYFSPSIVEQLPLQEKRKNELLPRNGLCRNNNNNIEPCPSTALLVQSLALNLNSMKKSSDSSGNCFSSPVKNVPIPQLSPDENKLVQQFNIKPCTIRVPRVMDNNSKTYQNSSPECPETEKIVMPCYAPIKKQKQCQIPVADSPSHYGGCSGITTTPIKLSTPHRVVSSFAEAVRESCSLWGGVRDFRNVALALLPPYFVDLTQNEKYEELGNDEAKFLLHFEDTLKQVFPWWREDLKELLVKNNNNNEDQQQPQDDLVSEDGHNSEDGLMTVIKDEDLPDALIFEETFWNQEIFLDARICSLCGETGDFPFYSSGRLLHVNPQIWIHVNCAIWSSEVWEEQTGSLQQVEVALLRGKKTECEHCAKTGATLNCCTASCRKCFHFQCAIDSGCVLQSDKSVFCSLHSAHAKGQVQKEMHVTRKVFVSGSSSNNTNNNGRSGNTNNNTTASKMNNNNNNNKELMSYASNRLKLFIGSTRVDRLGHLVPISVMNLVKNRNNSLLLPVNFHVTALKLMKFNKEEDEEERKRNIFIKKYDIQSWHSALDKTGDFRKSINNEKGKSVAESSLTLSNYSVVIDHSKRPDMIQLRLKEAGAFWAWIKNVNKFVDEFNVEWSPIYRPPSRRRKKAPDSAPFGSKNLVHRASLEWKPSLASSFDEDLLNSILSHPRLRFLLEQLPGLEEIPGSYRFRFCDPCRPLEDVPVAPTPSGCARSEPFSTRRPHDMFNWLRSQHRQPPKLSGLVVSEETAKSKGLPIAMRFRNLKERATKDLVVVPSFIHGRGLFAQRDIGMGEMLIEYAGELIRSVLCDVRERKYERAGIGCYMFRVNRDLVVDATLKGNAARFINHSCDPNCESKAVKILGKDHILIFALSNIGRGEELTYDYKFERELDKLPCACASRKCRKYLN